MRPYQRDFIKLAIECQALSFGQFTLKSGRISPYFFNAARFNTGDAISRLGKAYAAAITESQIDFDVIFGPAYKGIVLSASTAIALAGSYNLSRPYCFNRKEAKKHGEGGVIVGAPLQGRVMIIDDVITAGTAIREAADLIAEANAVPAAVVVGLDRQEKGTGEQSAITQVEQAFNIPVISIVSLNDIIDYLEAEKTQVDQLDKMKSYRQTYGVND